MTGSVLSTAALTAEVDTALASNSGTHAISAAALRQMAEDMVTTAAASLPLAGGTMTGPVVLSADPTAALQPATKQYADAGDSTNATAAAAAQTTATAALPKAGGTMTGALVLSGAPTLGLHPATKTYADAETTRAVAAEATLTTAAAAAQTTANAALPKAGGTMTGALVLAAVSIAGIHSSTSYDNDVAAAAGGVAVDQVYRNGNLLMVRLS